ncbi:MAG TPA: hypothetical protein VH352_02620 [Pseudonocardiaceae bacterium]|nr:hypothetical protein [Pseudonocardiaceae bacterium]
MERRRLAVVLAGLVLVGGAVAVLRLTNGAPDATATPPPPPLPTVVKPYSAVGVVAPLPGDPPAAPARLVLTPGPHRLLASWGSTLAGGHDPQGATGYDIRWGTSGSLTNEKLVAEPDAELNGLDPGAATRVEVRSVDGFGQRSAPATAIARPESDGPPGADSALVDHFDGAKVLDPRLWRMTSPSNCAQASRGTGEDSARLVILSECGRGAATLRARTPFRLNTQAANGELGRFTIDTDAPGESGELDVDLVPGPVDTVDGSTNDPVGTTTPGIAAIDPYLPPGTVRVRIAANIQADTNQPLDTVEVAAGPNTPLVLPVSRQLHAIPAPRLGVSVRWDVVVRTDGIEVLRDGVPVAAGNVVPSWTTSTALVEFTGSTVGQMHAGVSLIGFGGARMSAPPVAASPTLVPSTFVVLSPGASRGAITSTDTGPGSGQLRLTVVAAPNTPAAPLTVNGVAPNFQVSIGSQTFAALPAIPDTELLPEVRYPLVAQIPAKLLTGASLPISVSMDVPSKYPAEADLVQADLELTPGPHTHPASVAGPTGAGVVPVPAELAVLAARVLNANGEPVPNGQPLPRGRVVLEITMDGLAGQRAAWTLAGVAGFEVWLDNNELVAVPTAVGGPGVAGVWRVAFDPSQGTSGMHVIDIRAFGAAHGVAFGEAFTSFTLGT